MNMQVLIVSIIIVAAVVYVVRSIIKSAKGNACESGKCGCNTTHLNKSN